MLDNIIDCTNNIFYKKKKFITTCKYNIEYCENIIKGKTKNIILIHNIGYEVSYWNLILNTLHIHANTYTLDIYNMCDNIEKLSFETIICGIVELIEYLKLDNFYAIGHGFGGIAILELASIMPSKIIKIILSSISPTYLTKEIVKYDSDIFNIMQELFVTNNEEKKKELSCKIVKITDNLNVDHDNEIIKKLSEIFISRIEIYQKYIPLLLNTNNYNFNKIQIPILIILGMKDPYVTYIPEKKPKHINCTLIKLNEYGSNIPIFYAKKFGKYCKKFFFHHKKTCCPKINVKKINNTCCNDNNIELCCDPKEFYINSNCINNIIESCYNSKYHKQTDHTNNNIKSCHKINDHYKNLNHNDKCSLFVYDSDGNKIIIPRQYTP